MCFYISFFRNLSHECRITKENHKRGFLSCMARVLNFQNTKLRQNERSDIQQKLVFHISRSTDACVYTLIIISTYNEKGNKILKYET